MSRLKQIAGFFRLFYRYTRWRLPVLYLLISTGGVFEAVGIVALLPLLEVSNEGGAGSPVSQTIFAWLRHLGIEPTLPSLLVIIVVIFALRGGVVFVYTYFTSYITVSTRRDLQTELTRKFCDMSFPYYAQHTTGWFNNMIVAEVNRFISSMRAFCRISVSAIHALILLPLALSMQFELTIAVFAIGGLSLWSLRRFIRQTGVLSRQQTRGNADLNAKFIQLIQNFIYLKSTALMQAVSRHVIRTLRDLAGIELKMKFNVALLHAIKEPIAVTALAGFIFYEVGIRGGLLAETLVVALLFYRMVIHVVSLAPELQAFYQTSGGVYAVQDVARDLARHAETDGSNGLDRLDLPITFDKVSVRHGATEVLHDVDVTIRPNETIGIVGESGAGKTTFFHLLTGLLRPSSGRIRIGEHDYESLDKGSLRRLVGYVTQEPVIFNDSVANNVSMWQCGDGDDSCLERVRAAARAARCDEFVGRMADGFDTVLGDRGIKLSGGQRQRIAIARELFKNPRLLIFDEAASALDAESESLVQENINRMHGERTIVVITHRLASVRNCDRIYVFSAGRVVARGTFAELYGEPGSHFRRMCDQQGVSP